MRPSCHSARAKSRLWSMMNPTPWAVPASSCPCQRRFLQSSLPNIQLTSYFTHHITHQSGYHPNRPMTSYAHLSPLETLLMTLIAVVTNFAGLPLAFKTINHPTLHFYGHVFLMSVVTSSLYHLCQIYDCSLFLNELQWHRLDNVFAITSFQLMILHVAGAISPKDHSLKWSTLILSIIIQEPDPWNVTYTVLPCLWAVLLAVGVRLYHRKHRHVVYKRDRMAKGVACLKLGLVFFVIGLDDPNDYLRMSHGLWHLFASLFGYYCIDGVEVTDYRRITE